MMASYELLPHQYNTIKHIENKCNNQKGLLLWHYMGTGKTITGLAWLYHIMHYYTNDEYYIICPELIKSNWISTAKKMGIKLKEDNLLNYSDMRNMIENHQDKIKGKYLIVDEAHNLCKLVRDLINGTRTYYKIHKYLAQSNKVLFLTGTPFDENKSDLAILLNLCANEPFMPISEDKWLEKYADQSEFQENKKNSTFFNYVMPAVTKHGNNIIGRVHNLAYNVIGDPWDHLYLAVGAPLMMLCKPYTLDPLTNKVNTKLINISENDTLIKVQDKLGRYDPFGKLLNEFISHTSINKEKEDKLRAEVGKSTFINKVMFGFAGLLIFYLIRVMWDYVYDYFSYDNDINYMKYLDIDFYDVADDSRQYVSYYKYEGDPDYAEAITIHDPFRSILSVSTMTITIQFYFGKVSPKLLSFITGRTIKDLNLDSSLVLNRKGFGTYGRVLSNLPEFIEKIVTKPQLFDVNKNTGTVTMNHASKDMIKEYSSSKFVTLLKHIQQQNNKKKIMIYSDYVEQGAYLLSAYFTAMGVEHMYLNKNLSIKEQQKLLETFNGDLNHKIIILDTHSKEGISLFNIEELHFLEPPIDVGVKEQVIGRSIRFQSHKDLPDSKKFVRIYTHSSSIFRSTTENLTWLERIKTMDLKKILFGNLIDQYHNKSDNYKIQEIIQSQKLKHFGDKVQTTFNYYLDQYLEINFDSTVQGESIYGQRKASRGDKNKKKGSKKQNQMVVLSVDEHCEQTFLYHSSEVEELEENFADRSVADSDFFIRKKYECIKNNDNIIKRRFSSHSLQEAGKRKSKNKSKRKQLRYKLKKSKKIIKKIKNKSKKIK
jgi:superfamily II DNA or RNA helicase